MKKFLILLLMLSLSVLSVSAERYVLYEVHEGKISPSGELVKLNAKLTDANALGFACSNSACSGYSATLWNGKPLNTGYDNQAVLTYPTALQSKYGYGIFWYKPGYITWEAKADWWGTKQGETYNYPSGPVKIYLAKKQNCHAPIEDLKVINTQYENLPVMIEVDTAIDAQTYSAIRNSGPLNFIPAQLQDYYKVQTVVNLKITNSNNQVVFQDSKTLNIKFSNSEKVEFTWTPQKGQTGAYNIIVSTDVTDEKCEQSSKISQSSSKQIKIIENINYLKDKCYTILNNLELSEQFPASSKNLEITATKISNYMNTNNALKPVTTQVTLDLFDANNNKLHSEFSNLPANSDSYSESLFKFTIASALIHNAGSYNIRIAGISDDPQCAGKENIQDIISTGFIIEPTSPSQNHAPVISINDMIIKVGETKIITITASDADNDPLTYSIQKTPDAIVTYALNNNILAIKGVSAGTTTMSIIVSDGKDSASDLFAIQVTQTPVNPENHAPIITSQPITSAKKDELYQYQVTATDSDNDNLTYTVSGPEGMTISTSGLIQWTPGKVGKYNTRIAVSDGKNTALQIFTIEVTINRTKKHLFSISSEISAINSIAYAGKDYANYILLRNLGQKPEKNLIVKVTVPEIGFSQEVLSDLALNSHDIKWVPLMLKIPASAKPGKYLFIVEIRNKYLTAMKYGTIEIKQPENQGDKY